MRLAVLHVLSKGKLGISKVVYKSNINTHEVLLIVDDLRLKGFIEVDYSRKRRFYGLTEKGRMVLAEARQLYKKLGQCPQVSFSV